MAAWTDNPNSDYDEIRIRYWPDGTTVITEVKDDLFVLIAIPPRYDDTVDSLTFGPLQLPSIVDLLLDDPQVATQIIPTASQSALDNIQQILSHLYDHAQNLLAGKFE